MTSSVCQAFEWPLRLIRCAQQLLAPSAIERSMLLSAQGSDSDFSGGAAGWEAAAGFLTSAAACRCYNVDLGSRSVCAAGFARLLCHVFLPLPLPLASLSLSLSRSLSLSLPLSLSLSGSLAPSPSLSLSLSLSRSLSLSLSLSRSLSLSPSPSLSLSLHRSLALLTKSFVALSNVRSAMPRCRCRCALG